MEVRKRKNADGGASVNAGDDRTPSSVSSTSDRTVRSNVMVSMILLDSSKAPRLMQSAFSTLGDLYLYKLSDALYGESVASCADCFLLFYQMANWFMFFCMNRTFSNCLETVLTIMGLYYYRSFQGLSSQSEVRFGHSGSSTCRQIHLPRGDPDRLVTTQVRYFPMEKHQIPMEYLSVGFIGAGKMAESIARGMVASGLLPPHHISTAVHSNLSRHEVFQSFGVNVFSSNEEVVEESDVVIFSVKPQVVKKAITELRSKLTKDKLLVSVAAGITLKDLQEWSGHDRFIRVMPNTPAAVGEGASVMSLGTAASEEDGALVAKLFGSVGKMFKADEKMFDAVTGLSGSGPAYVFLAIEALADGGVAAGLPRELALGLASQTVLGAATMVSKTGKHPGVLKDDVTSPGGTTIAGVHELEKGSFRATLMNAVVAAANRSRELSQS
uniref:Pyrroline-5-carboxylate reductase n=2 Tax=Brassica campestris TaxID=3711 RepID=M4CPY1_BRACM